MTSKNNINTNTNIMLNNTVALNEGMVNSAIAQGQQSQQHLKVMSQQKMNKSPSSYMSEENAPPYLQHEQKKIKFYAQIEQIKDTRLIENLSSLKSKTEKQTCINSFAEIYDAMLKNILEIGEIVKQIRFNDPNQLKANAPTGMPSQASSGQNNGNNNNNNPNSNNLNAASSLNPNINQNPNNITINDPKNNVEIGELPDQIIKDCKSIHNIYADLIQDSSLKHLELCCETFGLDGSAINLKFKISSWYTDIKEYVEKNRPLTQSGRNSGKKNGSGKGIGSILCPCFGSKSKPTGQNNTVPNQTQNQLARNGTNVAVQNQRSTFDPAS